MFDDFQKLAENEKIKFRDATIEMDILIKKANSLTNNIADSLNQIENRLQGLDIEKTNLKKVEDDIKVISSAARDVNKQIEYIAMAKNDFLSLPSPRTTSRYFPFHLMAPALKAPTTSKSSLLACTSAGVMRGFSLNLSSNIAMKS